ncbi:DUF2179 domain-containing protein [Planctomicrobium piriforme]|uniref:Uncharacterized protein YebE, UPF0316 family n=1 Tax=Planctomicrobium piriforme TaxID=1576369 RepID=A0A1I3LXG6_9PLAN|nr:DUF5698 domain-containing protein [Planctomicrobium piriforme]SFI89471.1 Uncharacterized protein YebE, UPF0316 family [Planctomicrobium piriforme]
MSWLDGLQVWQLALAIFSLRIVDVSMGTLRTICVVQGRTLVSVCLGFCEVLVWITVMNQVIHKASGSPLLLMAYAGGFATGNAVGIALERWLALGAVMVRVVSTHHGEELADMFRDRTARVFSFDGRDSHDPMTLIYVVMRRREVKPLIALARRIDPDLFYSVESLRESSALVGSPLSQPAGLRKQVESGMTGRTVVDQVL